MNNLREALNQSQAAGEISPDRRASTEESILGSSIFHGKLEVAALSSSSPAGRGCRGFGGINGSIEADGGGPMAVGGQPVGT
jgi:hypothetical protein